MVQEETPDGMDIVGEEPAGMKNEARDEQVENTSWVPGQQEEAPETTGEAGEIPGGKPSAKRRARESSEGDAGGVNEEDQNWGEEADGEPRQEEADDDSLATVGPDVTKDWESFKTMSLDDLSAYGVTQGVVKTRTQKLVPCGVVSLNGSVQWA